MSSRALLAFAILLLGVFGAHGAVRAQYQQVLPNGTPTYEVPGLENVDVEEHLDEAIPLDVEFTDHEGRKVTLRDYFDGERPVVLTFAYHTCPTLCSLVLDATRRGLTTQDWTAGQEYQVVTISIDPEETVEAAATKRDETIAAYRAGEGAVLTEFENGENGEALARDAVVTERGDVEWHFLVGSEESIEAVTSATGYSYFYDEFRKQYAHPAAVMFLTPDGKLARYLYGLRLEHNDVRLALLEASEGRSISTGERFLLYCYAYDGEQSGYVLVAMNIMKIGGALTVLIVGAFLIFFWRRERKRATRDSSEPGSHRELKQVQA